MRKEIADELEIHEIQRSVKATTRRASRMHELPDNSKKFMSRKLSTASGLRTLFPATIRFKRQIIPIYKTAINMQIGATVVLI